MTKHLLRAIANRIPRQLPRDQKAMESYICEILASYNLPETYDYKRALAKMIHGVTQNTHRVPISYFYSHLRRYEAMLAAVQAVTEIEKQKQQAATPKVESPPEPQVENQRV